ncbi:hypothetical protein [Schlegelella aquatica]|uniref:hypothetical protein n=1 Tax=Caldimonas aquatica TaxID=376175 RepID=UPI00375032CB
MDWSTWIQQVGSGLIDKYADSKWRQPYEIQKLQMEALGQMGYYREGQPSSPQQGSISPTMLLLIGGAVLVVVLMRD